MFSPLPEARLELRLLTRLGAPKQVNRACARHRKLPVPLTQGFVASPATRPPGGSRASVGLGPGPQPTTRPRPGPQPTTRPRPGPQPTTRPRPGPQPTTRPRPGPQPTTRPRPGPQPQT